MARSSRTPSNGSPSSSRGPQRGEGTPGVPGPGAAHAPPVRAARRGSAGCARCRRRRAPACRRSRARACSSSGSVPPAVGASKTAVNQKTLPPPGLGRDADLAAERLHDLPGDGQPEAGAAVHPGGRGVGLGERVEEVLRVVVGDAHAGVLHLHPQHASRPSSAGSAVARTNTSPRSVNFTAFEPRLVSTCASRVGSPAQRLRHVGVARDRSAPGPCRGPPGRARRPPGRRPGGPRSRAARAPAGPASILEKSRMSLMTLSRARLATCTPEESRSCSASRPVRSSRSLRPMTPLRGVRISWLMVARNSDFCREASMAASRAAASSASARSRSATRPSWTATCSTIERIMSWR